MGLSLLIVVLHYSGPEDTRECMASLGRQSYENFHTLVVENGAIEPLDPAFAAQFPAVEVLRLGENLGWSGGNNAGIRLAIERDYDAVCLLNNDTILPEHAVARLMETAEALGPCILNPAIESYGADETPQLDPTIPEPPGLVATPVPDRSGVFEVNTASGCCLIAHLSVFRRIGLIDERFFLLFEDADINRRAVAAGCHIYCDAGARIQHKESKSFGGRRAPIKTYYSVRNMLLYHEKHGANGRGWLAMLRHLPWTVWGVAEASGAQLRSWWGLLGWIVSKDLFARAVRMGVRDYLLRRFGRLNQRDALTLTPRRDAATLTPTPGMV